jgi:hypothetical protein
MRGIEIAMRRGVWCFALTLGVLGACSNKSSNTKIMVAVWSNLAVPHDLDSIRIVAQGSSTSASFTFPLITGSGKDVIKFPVVWELVSPDNKGAAFDVTASGYLGTNVVVAQTAHLSFDPGHSRVLTLFLDRACVGATSGPCAQPIAVDGAGLPEYDPRTPFLAPDASPETLDATASGRAETGDVELGADVFLVADLRQGGDATTDGAVPDAGPDLPVDAPDHLDGASDTPADLAAKDDLGQDRAGPDTCVSGCTQIVDAAFDNPALDAAPDAFISPVIDAVGDRPADGPMNRDVSLEASLDLPPPLDLGKDLTVQDDAAACVLPMTTCAGACVNPQTNASHCGGCGQACGTKNGTPSCAAGVCSMATCLPGFLNCSVDENTSRDGCETNATTDSANCGHCGNVCSSRVCRNQTCLATARYGNTGAGIGVSGFEGNYLAGIQVYIPNDSVVTGFGAVLYSAPGIASATMYLGLYKDMAGSPGALAATVSTSTVVTPGGKEMNVVPPVSVTAGTYWILGVWDSVASFATNSATTVTWSYASYPFAILPATAPTNMATTSLLPPNLYVIVAQ